MPQKSQIGLIRHLDVAAMVALGLKCPGRLPITSYRVLTIPAAGVFARIAAIEVAKPQEKAQCARK